MNQKGCLDESLGSQLLHVANANVINNPESSTTPSLIASGIVIQLAAIKEIIPIPIMINPELVTPDKPRLLPASNFHKIVFLRFGRY